DIDHADVVLVLGTDPIHSAPAFDLRVRKAVRRNGTALAVATERPSALDGGASEVERIKPGDAAGYLANLLDQVKSGSTDGIAGLLKDSGHTVVIWGERIGRGENGPAAIESLLELAGVLDLGGQEESGLIEIPDVANARGLREVGCLPDAGPGLSETEAGRDVEEIKAGLISGEVRAVVLYGVDPLRDFPDTEGWRQALEAADFVIHFTMASTDTTEFADVVFPLESHAEKDGTITHTEGRLQRVRPAAARPGDIRGGWHVLAELSAALGHETNIHAVPEALRAITEVVPFYAGLTDAEIGGRGIRWQDREAAGAWSLSAPAGSVGGTAGRTSPGVPSVPPTDPAEGPGGGLTLGTYRDLWANSTTDLSPALSYLIPAQRLEVSVADAERLGLSKGDEVSVKSGDTEVTAFVAIRAALPEGTCFLMEGTQQGNANVFATGKPAVVEIGKASPKLEVVAGNGNGGE
ncbi:MAG: molybdopterin-dependent oxidoreductase, partial [Solirubrobacterales bacterium]